MSDLKEIKELPRASGEVSMLEEVGDSPVLDEEAGLPKILDAFEKSRSKKGTPKKDYSYDRVVFQPPTEAEKRKDYGNEKATPTIDAAGRHRWIQTRECWCSANGDECRQHSPKEPGWETCPSKNSFAKPRKLWGTNPDFGKPLQREEADENTAKAA